MKADLHLHTTASDGKYTPEELVALAAEKGLSIISITDHDTVRGIAPALAAARKYPSLQVIPGVEINTDIKKGEVHILGYFIDYTDGELQRILETLKNSRFIRARKMVEKLRKMGFAIEWERVLEFAEKGVIGRPHIAQALLEKGYISSLKEAFNKYIGRDGPAYVEREKLTPEEAVRLITKVRGLPVLAHPGDLLRPEEVLPGLVEAGLVGLEAYYNGYEQAQVSRLEALAGKYGLLPIGGSDFHGLDSDNETPLGGARVPLEGVQQLIACHHQGRHGPGP